VHALLLCENALKAVWLTRIKLRLILKKPLLRQLLHLLSLVKLGLPLGHLSLLLQHTLLLLEIGNLGEKKKGKRALV
jgi:hypothetical protein